MIGRVRERRQFQELRRSGRRVRRGALSVTYVPVAPGDGPLLAFAIGRRFGSAVVRNRARRRVREAFRAVVSETGPIPVAALVQVRPPVLEQPFASLLDDVRHVLGTIGREVATR